MTLVVAEIPAPQRAALAWRLRNILAEADRRAAGWRRAEHGEHGDVARLSYLRGATLELIVELEGERRPPLDEVVP